MYTVHTTGRALGPDIPARLRSESTRASQLEAGRMLSVYSAYFGFVGAVNGLGRGGPHQPSERPRAIFKCMSHHRRSTERAGLKRKMQSQSCMRSRTFHGLCLHPAPITKPQMVQMLGSRMSSSMDKSECTAPGRRVVCGSTFTRRLVHARTVSGGIKRIAWVFGYVQLSTIWASNTT